METTRFDLRLKGDKVLWRLLFVFSLISLIFVYSSSTRAAVAANTTTFYLMIKQMGFIIVGLFVTYVCHQIQLKWYRKLAYLAFWVFMGLLVITLIAGQTINEGTRWLNILGFSFQTSEFAKVVLVIYVAKILEDKKLDTFWEYLLKFLVWAGIYTFLILWEGMSTGIILGTTVLLMLLVSDIKFSHIAKTAGILVVLIGLMFVANEIVVSRSKKHPDAKITSIARVETVKSRLVHRAENNDEKEGNEQVLHSKIAVASGGVFGKFPGNGTQNYSLPHSNKDYIFSVIVEETGLFGGAVVILLYLWILYRVVSIARACKKVFSSELVFGLGVLIVLQALIHILVNVGIFPVTGQNLPFISLGGSSILATSIAFGIILSVSRTLEDEKEQVIEKQKTEQTPIENEQQNA